MMTPTAQTKDVMSFGPFSLVASERLLTKDGAPVELGARALDILIALMSRPNEVVSKKDCCRGSGPTSPSKKAACGFTWPACARRWATERTARDTSRRSPGGAIASSRRSRGRAIGATCEPCGRRQFSARQSAQPLEPNGRPR